MFEVQVIGSAGQMSRRYIARSSDHAIRMIARIKAQAPLGSSVTFRTQRLAPLG